MAGFKHLLSLSSRTAQDGMLKGMEKLVPEIDAVKSFEWGQDIESEETFRQGFTQGILMTFDSKEDYTALVGHASHVVFSAKLSTAIDKVVLLDFPCVVAKGSA